MPSITREQALKLNAQAPNGWTFDAIYYITWGEKTLIRNIELNDEKRQHLQARLMYRENHIRRTNEWRVSWNEAAGNYHIELHCSIFRPGSVNGIYVSDGLGKWENLDNGHHPKKIYKNLCKFAETVSDDQIFTLAGVNPVPDDLALLQLPS